MRNKFIILFFLFIIFFTTTHSARELQIYADSIVYDSNNNLVAKGNVKVIQGNQILTSTLVIINEKQKKITLPKEFKFKDE